MKKILIVCSGNSCRSIIAEALVNHFLKGYEAQSCGANPLGKVNPNAKKVLEDFGIWDERYHSKHIDDFDLKRFDLVVSVCDNAKESCVVLPDVRHLHYGFEDPDGKEIEAFYKTLQEIKQQLLPAIQKECEK